MTAAELSGKVFALVSTIQAFDGLPADHLRAALVSKVGQHEYAAMLATAETCGYIEQCGPDYRVTAQGRAHIERIGKEMSALVVIVHLAGE